MSWLKKIQWSWVVVGLFTASASLFIVQRVRVSTGRQLDFIERYVSLTNSTQIKFHRKVGVDIESDAWQKYFYTGSISAKTLRLLTHRYKEISGLAFLNENGDPLAQNIKLPASHILYAYMKKARKAHTYTQLLDKRGWFRIYPAYSSEDEHLGYVVFRWMLPGNQDGSAMFFLDIDIESLLIAPEDHFSRSQKKVFIENLADISMQSKSDISITSDSVEYSLYWTYWENEGIYVGMVKKKGTIFSMGGFYALSLSTLLLVMFMVIQRPNVLTYFNSEQEESRLRETLEKQNEALSILKQQMEEMRTTYKATEDIEDEEKVVAGRIIEEELEVAEELVEDTDETLYSYEEPEEETEEPIVEEKGKIRTIELKPLKREFIFLDPTDESWREKLEKKNAQSDDEVAEKLKKKAFTPEVVDLIRDISLPEEKDDLYNRLKIFEALYRDLTIDDFTSYLNELYFDEVTFEEIEKVLSYLQEKVKADGALLLKYNSILGCYQPIAKSNLPESVVENFYVLKDDPVLPFSEEDVTLLPMSDIANDDFLQKRFGYENWHVKVLLSFPLHQYFLEANLLLFYNNDTVVNNFDSIKTSMQKYLPQITPALKYYFLEEESFTDDLSDDVLREFKVITNNGQMAATVLHIKPNQTITTDGFNALKKNLYNTLNKVERFIHISPSSLVALLQREEVSEISSVIEATIPGCEIEEFKFPELGKSFYSYI